MDTVLATRDDLARALRGEGKNMKKIFIFSLIFFIQTAGAFTLNSSTDSTAKGWSNPELAILVNPAACPASVDIISAVRDAIDFWNKIPTSRLQLSYGGTTTSTASGSPPVIYCEVNFQASTGGSQDSIPGVAYVSRSGQNIASGRIVLNSSAGLANIANLDKTYLSITIAHEIGHLIGLGHSQSQSALMYYSIGSKLNVALSQDDMDGASYLYPLNELDGDKIAGCGLVSRIDSNRGGPSHFILSILLLCLLPLALALKLRSQSVKSLV